MVDDGDIEWVLLAVGVIVRLEVELIVGLTDELIDETVEVVG